jgi:hypothetical protein
MSHMIVEMIPRKNGKAMECFPSGAIAQAWLIEYPQQLTWDDLKKWLERCARPLKSHPVQIEDFRLISGRRLSASANKSLLR